MKVKEEYVSITKAERIFEIIKQSLNVTKDIQIFVAKELIEELERNGTEHHVFEFNGRNCFHYNKDIDGFGGENWFGYHEGYAFSPLIASASFISICGGYYQLVEFLDKKVSSDYTHYTVGFKELLLIEVDTQNVTSNS